jgi:hypothetical protein
VIDEDWGVIQGYLFGEVKLIRRRVTDVEWRLFERFVIETVCERGRPPALSAKGCDALINESEPDP